MTKKKNHGASVFALGALAGIAGALFLYGKNSGKNRKMVKGWMLKARGEVLEELEKVQDMDEAKYKQIVEKVSKKYAALKNVDAKDLETTVKELRSHWKNIVNAGSPKKRSGNKKKVAKKKA